MHPQTGGIARKFQAGQLKNLDLSWLTLHFFALSSQVAKLLPVNFDGGVHGRNLLDFSAEFRQNVEKIRFGNGNFPLLQHSSRDVLGVRVDTQAQGGFVDFLRMLKKFHTPGCTTHKHRQNAGCHGV